MLQLSPQQIKTFQKKILTWYASNQRDLPWRKTRDPYHILISEVMSQQTQISRVVPKYEAWIKTLPTVHDLADAPTATVLTLWSGLGYNRRAVYLQKAAQKIVTDFNGAFPEDEKVLQTLPGIGEYTAKAILCFAFDKQVAVVDTNVRKVIITALHKSQYQLRIKQDDVSSLLHDSSTQTVISEKDIQSIAGILLPHGQAYEWNQALMDYAGAVLKKEKILVPKQSTFKGSDRYYRGQIMKILIARKTITKEQISFYFFEKNPINQTRLEKIIAGLCSDGLLGISEENIFLPYS